MAPASASDVAVSLDAEEPLRASGTSQRPKRTRIDLHALQLDQRVRELYAAHAAFTALLADPSGIQVGGLSPTQSRAWAATFPGNVDTEAPALAGHSFGAATVLRAVESPPADYPPLRLRGVIALDHWFAPFSKLVRPPRAPEGLPRVLAINSQEYTEAEQWPRVLDHCKDLGAALVTILGTTRE